MSKLRMAVSRLLALGGLTAVSGTSYVLYKYSSLNEKVDCRGAVYGKKDFEPVLNSQVKWDDDWDCRKIQIKKDLLSLEPQEITHSLKNVDEKPKPTATRHVLLVRHGQYITKDSDEERILTDIGRQQAAATGVRLKSLNISFNKITVSTMTRAKETGVIISDQMPEVPIEYCSLIREGAPYPPEPPSKSWNPERWVTFYKDNPRIEGAFRKYFHRADSSQKEDSFEVLVCHGNVIRYFVCRALQFPPEGWLRMSIGNCGITWLTIRPNGSVSLRGLGDVGHLPPELITFN
ncbi:serine/threonine-protein phosphatase PGAM5, mitochondrial isoform X1 [Hydra vulgaris]|uniref:serine/threonine-protein phosphatase PGAM5, mitochondrial isoform X1 n=1 Tax=Hydra vulgaris TaxID=6087 RepID=UPI001F5E84FB|nr:serine/threonine-protein phosphatase PGAM5, mitochondrial isoform X1 [Hydra vulgaris]